MLNVNTFFMIPRRYIMTVKLHRPLIKFRKGAVPETSTARSSEEINVYKQQNVRPVLEDFQLPPRYRRQPLDENEIAVINSGGVY